jgi:hypothetical protein
VISLSDLIPNIDDASPDEVFAAAAEVDGAYLKLLDNGNVVCDPSLPDGGAYILSRQLMDKVLQAVNVLAGVRRLKAAHMEADLAGTPIPITEYLKTLEADLAGVLACNAILQATCDIALENGDRLLIMLEELQVENDELRRKAKPRRRFGW